MRGIRQLAAAAVLAGGATFAQADLADALAALKKVGKEGAGNAEAAAAWKVIAAAKPGELTTVLAGWKGLHPVAANYLHSAVVAAADAAGPALPTAALETFLKDSANVPDARRLAFELVVRGNPDRKEPLLDGLRDDPSKELRFDAVAQTLTRAAAALKAEEKTKALELFEQALASGREESQVGAAASAVRKLGKPLDLARHFGLIQEWRLIGPFDNKNAVGWAKAYPPEKSIDFDAELPGQLGPVKWFSHATTDEMGAVDMNAVYKEPRKGSVTYAVADFDAKEAVAAEIRLGSIVAWKLWLNGEPLYERNESHAGFGLDQYTVPAKFKAGKNRILLKLCQNEQTEPWAQNYNFALRVCDANGTAILSADRPAAKPTLGAPPEPPAGKDAPKADAAAPKKDKQ